MLRERLKFTFRVAVIKFVSEKDLRKGYGTLWEWQHHKRDF